MRRWTPQVLLDLKKNLSSYINLTSTLAFGPTRGYHPAYGWDQAPEPHRAIQRDQILMYTQASCTLTLYQNGILKPINSILYIFRTLFLENEKTPQIYIID